MEFCVALQMYGAICASLTLPNYVSLLWERLNVVVYYAMLLWVVKREAPMPCTRACHV